MDYIEIVDTGPPQFYPPGLIVDGLWHVMDFSPYLPSGTKAVNLRYKVAMAAVGSDSYIRFRVYGSTSSHNNCLIRPQVNGRHIAGLLLLGLSTDLKIEYQITNETWDTINLHIRGYFL